MSNASIEKHVLAMLEEFVAQDKRSFFEDDQSEFIRSITTGQASVDTNERIPSYEVFDDFGFVAALGEIIDSLETWSREVSEIRDRYFWDNLTDRLPEDFMMVFGFCGPLANQLDTILKKSQRVIDRLKAKYSVEPSKMLDACNLWNSSRSIEWRDVFNQFCDDGESVGSFKQRVKRFADANGIVLQAKKAGKKPGKS